MSIGKELRHIREKAGLTQAELAEHCHVTRQTVSSWENEKSYPDLQTLINISNDFGVSLDTLLKGDAAMVRALDRTAIRREKKWMDFCSGAGMGLLLSCLSMPDSLRRTAVIAVGLALLAAGIVLQKRYDKRVSEVLEK